MVECKWNYFSYTTTAGSVGWLVECFLFHVSPSFPDVITEFILPPIFYDVVTRFLVSVCPWKKHYGISAKQQK